MDQLWLFVFPALDHIPFNSEKCREISQALKEALTRFGFVNILFFSHVNLSSPRLLLVLC